MNDNAPALDRDRFNCARCGAFSHHEWFELYFYDENGSQHRYYDDVEYVEADPAKTVAVYSNWKTSECKSCNERTTWRKEALIHPPLRTGVERAHELMDAAAKVLYEEAASVLPVSRRASAALARAALEVELKALEIGPPDSRLDDRIALLSTQVSEPLWQLLTVLRDTGNRVLHSKSDDGAVALFLDEADAELAPVLLGSINQVVDELVAKPQRASDLFSLLPDGVQAAAQRKRDAQSRP
ncbi:DUF4145 domain-containing protein [Leucobacter chromiireducens]|uniref:DUF4145 domain-containing protein n=1 Tax=Leucobacter chromiireducens subsp. chromiireducens TaxID=660067 RepID=A0ABS1SLJ0_9MICO|nr:DUF4145 domain-containing protein [Leucobacter chromiireducens]MBL3688958.1 DUF4145 domain-containing protein [Leucobacter chromiireducens subsp. chromiireducens]